MLTTLRRASWLRAATLGIGLAGGAGLALAADPPKEEEVPFWAIGMPKGNTLAPVPSFPIPTPVDKLPVGKLKLPPGFKVEVWAGNILDARGLRLGDQGTVFVSSLFVAGKIYAVTDKGGKREVKTIAEKLFLPNGIEYYKGALYVATPKEITRYDNIEANLDHPPAPVLIYDKLTGEVPHGWKYIRVGPDGKLYVPVGAPCNICAIDDRHAQIRRINLDGTGEEMVALGVRNSVGFDFDPKTGDLWFTNNGRDWLSEDFPNDTLNHVSKSGNKHFGYPFCHQGNFADPEYGWGKNCADYAQPAQLMGAHVATLGMRFYTGTMFPAKYRGAMFIARHGSWNKSQKVGADVVVAWPDDKGGVAKVEPFLSGFIENNEYLGRPVDVMQMKDGSLLISDDHAGAIYRVSYTGS
ncbi:MAG TPA: PQQ-dependent sugar dehydrogenase [Caldimonas sp.]|nr:PQQ-dependent sugar dehydrogenase [Caldimonas sp.]